MSGDLRARAEAVPGAPLVAFNPATILALLAERDALAAKVEAAEADAAKLRELAAAAIKTIARVEALADEWETAHGDPPVDPSHISVRHAHDLRAALEDAS